MIKKAVLFTLATLLCAGIASVTRAQNIAANVAAPAPAEKPGDDKTSNGPATKTETPKKSGSTLEEQLTALTDKMNKLEAIIEAQQKTIDELQRQKNSETTSALNSPVASNPDPAPAGMRRRPADDESPLTFHIGSATITPVGQLEFTTVFRTTATGNTNGTNTVGTSFGTLPFNNTVQGHLTETRLSAQNSRVGFRVDTKVHDWDVTGFVEADLFGNNAANVFVSANRHTAALRNYWVDARRGKFEIMGGQGWSLLTPNRKGLSPLNEDVFSTRVIDANYQVGLSWARQAQLRFIYHPSDRWAFGVSVENPEQFVGTGEVIFPFAFNAQLGPQFDAGNNAGAPNLIPDIIGKVAFDSRGSRHYHVEVAGLLREFKATVLPIVVPCCSPGFNGHSVTGFGGSVNADLEVLKNVHFVSNNFLASGGSRYVFGLGPDLVVIPIQTGASNFDVRLQTIDNFSTVQGLEAQVNNKLLLYGYYGGAYFRHTAFPDVTSPLIVKPTIGFGGTNSPNSANRAIQEATGGLTYTLWQDPKYGALEWAGQASYVTRSSWFVAAGAPKNAHLAMAFFSLRYVLPGKSPKSN